MAFRVEVAITPGVGSATATVPAVRKIAKLTAAHAVRSRICTTPRFSTCVRVIMRACLFRSQMHENLIRNSNHPGAARRGGEPPRQFSSASCRFFSHTSALVFYIVSARFFQMYQHHASLILNMTSDTIHYPHKHNNHMICRKSSYRCQTVSAKILSLCQIGLAKMPYLAYYHPVNPTKRSVKYHERKHEKSDALHTRKNILPRLACMH